MKITKMYNINNIEFCKETFWSMMETLSDYVFSNDICIYCFHKSGEKYYIKAYNEYDLMIKLTKNYILADYDVYEDLTCVIDPAKTFKTENELYRYLVHEYIRFYREVSNFYYEKLNIIS